MEGEDEHPPSSLRHSEVASVENPVGPPIPEFAQRTEERPKVFAGMTGEESRYILEEDGGRSVSLHKGEECEGEAGTLAGKSAALSCDGEILTGEATGPEDSTAKDWFALTGSVDPSVRGCMNRPSCQRNDTAEVGDIGPSLGEDRRGVGVDLGEADGAPSSSLQSKVKSADA